MSVHSTTSIHTEKNDLKSVKILNIGPSNDRIYFAIYTEKHEIGFFINRRQLDDLFTAIHIANGAQRNMVPEDYQYEQASVSVYLEDELKFEKKVSSLKEKKESTND